MVADKTQSEKDIPQAKVDETPQGEVASPEGKETSPIARTYTQEQVDKLTQLASMKAGRDRKVVEVERDGLKAKVEDYEKKIVVIEEERESLQKLIDEDPDKLALATRDKTFKDKEKKLQDSLDAHEADKKAYAQQIQDAKALTFQANAYLISKQFVDGDKDKLEELCEKFGAETEDEIKSIAETLWSLKEEEAAPPLETDSGRTSGGAISDEQATLNRLYPSMAKK